MLKKKRASGGWAINSNQTEYPTVPWKDALEVEEMMMMDHFGTSAVDEDGEQLNSNQTEYSIVPWKDALEVEEYHFGTSAVELDEDGEQLDYLQMAWLLQEKLNDFVEGGKGGPPGLELRTLLDMAASCKIVSVDSKKMSHVLRRTLPKELLLLVFTRLPVPDITRLRNLSKEWNQDMATANSEINRALDKTSRTMVAGFSCGGGFRYSKSEFLVTICSQRSQYSYRLHPGNPVTREDGWDDMGARDGGLVCFVSTWRPSKANPLCIVVVNLLTQVQRKLPPLQYVYKTPPKLMHIKVDSETKCYRVVVVGKNIKGRSRVEIYDSSARQWTKATLPLGFIFGVTYKWLCHTFHRNLRRISPIQSVYDFTEGKLKRCDEQGPSRGRSVLTHTLHQDCMFVLLKNTSSGEMLLVKGYYITKYRIQANGKDWVQERSYLCSPYEALLEKHCRLWTLKACEGFLMVIAYSSGSHMHSWLLDLATGEWSSLSNCFEGHEHGFLMSRVAWNVVP